MPTKDIGLAIIGCGTIGRIRAELAREHPSVGWLGLCDRDEEVMGALARDTKADFCTTDFQALVKRPEVTAVIVATDENWHVEPILASVECGHALFIEKPLATHPVESERVLKAIETAKIDAVVGYTQRFRRRFQGVRQKIVDGRIGDVTTVVTRAFLNRMVPLSTLPRANMDQRALITPMVISGTHCLDVCMWMLEGTEAVEVWAKSTDRVLGSLGTKDCTLGILTMANGVLLSMNVSWALPVTWPGAVYGLQIGIVGTSGVIDIEDTHRDVILAAEESQGPGYNPKGYDPGFARTVDFLGSYPPGDLHDGHISGPMREETLSWLNRLVTGLPTAHATVADGHRNLLLTMAMDLSARTGAPVKLPVDPAQLASGLK